MRKILFNLILLSIFSVPVFAQHVVATASVGVSFRYRPAGSSWTKGSYFDVQGVQHTGFLMIDYTSVAEKSKGTIEFRTEKHGDKTTIPVENLDKVILDTDTMVVSHSPLLSFPFITEVVHKNALKLYNMQEAKNYSMTGAKDTWYYGPNKENLTLIDKKNFITVMPQIMADEPGVVQNILNKQYKYNDMIDLITYYQTGREPWKDRDNQ